MIIYNFCLWLTVSVRVLSWIIIQINSLYFIISNYRVFIKPCYICHVFRYQIEKLLKIQNRISNFIILFKILPFSYLLKWTWTGINSSRPIFKPVKSPMKSLKIFKGIKTRKIRCLENVHYQKNNKPRGAGFLFSSVYSVIHFRLMSPKRRKDHQIWSQISVMSTLLYHLYRGDLRVDVFVLSCWIITTYSRHTWQYFMFI